MLRESRQRSHTCQLPRVWRESHSYKAIVPLARLALNSHDLPMKESSKRTAAAQPKKATATARPDFHNLESCSVVLGSENEIWAECNRLFVQRA